MRKFKFTILLILFFSSNIFADNDSTKVVLKTFSPETYHHLVYQLTGQILNTYHYKKIPIDDKLSSTLLDNYLKHLDPNKFYFTSQDISGFEKYRYTFDDNIVKGNVQAAFDIYNIYQARVEGRINYSLDLLKTEFDYNIKDSFLTNRDSATWASNFSDYDNIWKKKIKYECLLVKADGKDFKTYSDIVAKRYTNLLKQMQKTKVEDVFSVFMNSLTEIADPHTNYFSPRMAEDFNQSMSLSLEGIGATLQTENEYTKIRDIVKGGPADKSKLLGRDDRIVAVGQGKDGEMVNILDWRIDDVVSKIRGKKGSIVRLEIIPKGELTTKTKIVEIVRDKIILEEQSAKSKIKEVKRNGKTYKVGIISLPTFYLDFAALQRGDNNYKSTTRDVRKLVQELKSKKIDVLLIDLRNNGGGSLQEAVELSGLFIKSGPIVQVRDAFGLIKSENDRDPGILWEGPLGVLVNRYSASASEIFAAAMQDYGRGIVIGEQTYGKGTVQSMLDLNNFMMLDSTKLGQIKTTIAKFYRVSGGSTQHKGVIPDISFPSAFDGDEFGEDANKFALPYDEIRAVEYNKVENNFASVMKEINFSHEKRMKSNDEYRFLEEDINRIEESRKKNFTTLNLEDFKSEMAIIDTHKKERERIRNKFKEKHKEDADLILDESEEIMLDINQAK